MESNCQNNKHEEGAAFRLTEKGVLINRTVSLSLSNLEVCIEGVMQLGSPREKRTSKTDDVLGNAFAVWLITLTSFLLLCKFPRPW